MARSIGKPRIQKLDKSSYFRYLRYSTMVDHGFIPFSKVQGSVETTWPTSVSNLGSCYTGTHDHSIFKNICCYRSIYLDKCGYSCHMVELEVSSLHYRCRLLSIKIIFLRITYMKIVTSYN